NVSSFSLRLINLSLFYFKYFGTVANSFKDMSNSVRMGIGDKNLPEIMITHQLHQVLNPLIIYLVKNIIKKQNRNSSGGFFYQIKLGKLKRNQKRFLLSLRSELL